MRLSVAFILTFQPLFFLVLTIKLVPARRPNFYQAGKQDYKIIIKINTLHYVNVPVRGLPRDWEVQR